MKNIFAKVIGTIIILALLAYMFCFQLRYDQVAVVSTFGHAKAPVYSERGDLIDPGSIKADPGLYLQWPWPIQRVTRYSTLVQVLEEQLEELQTRDGYAVILRTYVTWRIKDPLKFYTRITFFDNTPQQLRPLIRDTKAIVGRYDFADLVNIDPARVQLEKLEREAKAELARKLSEQDYGIEVVHFGIRRLVMPEKVTEKVFERMKAERQRLAEDARSSGEAQAKSIESQAEAAAFYPAFAKDQNLATFLRRLQTLEKILPNNTTFVLPAGQLSLQELLGGDGQER